MNWQDKLERKYRRFAVRDLMAYVSTGMVLVFVFGLIQNGAALTRMISLDRAAILRGQVWRLVTFIFMPPASGLLFMLITIYFYYYLGRTLENNWGSFRFTLYYLCGMVGCVVAAMLTGFGTNLYLNLSIFLAFAVIHPDMQILLFMIIPVKVKYIAYLDAAFFVWGILTGTMVSRAAAVFSLLNFFLFFGPGLIDKIKLNRRYSATRKNFRQQMRGGQNPWGF